MNWAHLPQENTEPELARQFILELADISSGPLLDNMISSLFIYSFVWHGPAEWATADYNRNQ